MNVVLMKLRAWMSLVGRLAAVGALLGAAPLGAAELTAALEAVVQRYVALPDALLPVLEAAQDKASADRAAADLQALLPRVYDTRRELREVSSLSAQQAAAVREKYEMQMRTRWGRVYHELFRLQRKHCYDSIAYFKHFQTLCMLLEK